MRLTLKEVDPPQRLLMGPGPVNAHPRVLRAMSAQLLGQFDPSFTAYMNEFRNRPLMHIYYGGVLATGEDLERALTDALEMPIAPIQSRLLSGDMEAEFP